MVSKAKAAAAAALPELPEVAAQVHRFFNARIFGGKLPAPKFEVSTALRSRHSRYRVVQLNGAGERDVITLNEGIGTFSELAIAVVHQMAHQAQYHWPEEYGETSQKLWQDDSYHSAEWHGIIQRQFGLQTEGIDAGRLGEITETRLFRAMLKDYAGARSWLRTETPVDRTPGSKNRLWMCSCTRVRAAVQVDATCNRCGKKFRRRD